MSRPRSAGQPVRRRPCRADPDRLPRELLGAPGSHADWIITKLMDGYWWRAPTPSRVDIASSTSISSTPASWARRSVGRRTSDLQDRRRGRHPWRRGTGGGWCRHRRNTATTTDLKGQAPAAGGCQRAIKSSRRAGAPCRFQRQAPLLQRTTPSGCSTSPGSWFSAHRRFVHPHLLP